MTGMDKINETGRQFQREAELLDDDEIRERLEILKGEIEVRELERNVLYAVQAQRDHGYRLSGAVEQP